MTRIYKWIFYYLGPLLLSLGPSTAIGQQDKDWLKQYDFVYLDTILLQPIYEVRYSGYDNFLGVPVTGYRSDRLVVTQSAATALLQAESHFNNLGFGLKIFDTYRPQRAVDHFKRWAKDRSDTLTKHIFYPNQDKRYLFDLGYISSRSGHSRGSTIDLTLYHLADCSEVDMGGPYDYFGEISHHTYRSLTATQLKYRALLRSVMSQFGFRAYEKEWWHYTLRREPYPDKYFDYVVSP